MCFGSMPKPKEPAPPPTERDAALTAVKKKQQAASMGGLDATNKTGGSVAGDTGGTRPLLGG